MRVLVVDDNRDVAVATAEFLRLDGHDIHVCLNGSEVIALVQQHDPECVLLDINLPGANGWDLAQQIRALRPHRRRLLIGISGEYTKGSDSVLGKMRGFDHYLMKPVDPRALLALLKARVQQ